MCKSGITGVEEFNHIIECKFTLFYILQMWNQDQQEEEEKILFSNFYKVEVWCQYATRFFTKKYYIWIKCVIFLTVVWRISEDFPKSFTNYNLLWFLLKFEKFVIFLCHICRKWFHNQWLHGIVVKGCVFHNLGECQKLIQTYDISKVLINCININTVASIDFHIPGYIFFKFWLFACSINICISVSSATVASLDFHWATWYIILVSAFLC